MFVDCSICIVPVVPFPRDASIRTILGCGPIIDHHCLASPIRDLGSRYERYSLHWEHDGSRSHQDLRMGALEQEAEDECSIDDVRACAQGCETAGRYTVAGIVGRRGMLSHRIIIFYEPVLSRRTA